MREALLAQIEALQQQALLLAAQAGAIARTVESIWPEQAEPEPEQDSEGRCLHPHQYRVRAASAGQPNRYACKRCNEYGGLKPKVTQESNLGEVS